jgi:hypothetical protein
VLADARVKAKSRNEVGARKEPDAMLASAREYGYLSYEFQARLALGEIELPVRLTLSQGASALFGK